MTAVMCIANGAFESRIPSGSHEQRHALVVIHGSRDAVGGLPELASWHVLDTERCAAVHDAGSRRRAALERSNRAQMNCREVVPVLGVAVRRTGM